MRSKKYYETKLKDLQKQLKEEYKWKEHWEEQLAHAREYERELIGMGKDRRYAWDEMDLCNEIIHQSNIKIDELRREIKDIKRKIEILEKRAKHLNTEKLRRIKKRVIKRAKQYHEKGWDWKTSMFFAWADVKHKMMRWEILSFMEVQGDE